jgi:hypothetical protein
MNAEEQKKLHNDVETNRARAVLKRMVVNAQREGDTELLRALRETFGKYAD